MKNRHWFPMIGVCAVVLAAGCSDKSEELKGEITVGAVFPFTGNISGAVLAIEQMWGLAVRHVNENGGVLGKKLVVKNYNAPAQSLADFAPLLAGFQEAAGDGREYIISFIFGPLINDERQIMLDKGILGMSMSAEVSALNTGFEGLLYRGILPTNIIIANQVAQLKAAGKTNFAVAAAEGEISAPGSRAGIFAAQFADCTTCSVETFPYSNTAATDSSYDWAGYIDQLMAAAPEHVFLGGANSSAIATLVNGLEDANFEGLYYFAFTGLIAEVVPVVPAAAVARFRLHEVAAAPSAALEQISTQHQEVYSAPASQNPRALLGADYIALLALAITKAQATDGRSVAAAFASVSNAPGKQFTLFEYADAVAAIKAGEDIDYQGISGPLEFNDRGDLDTGLVVELMPGPTGGFVRVP